MIRFYFPIVAITAIMSVVACSGRDPVADEVNSLAAAPVDIDGLPLNEGATAPADAPGDGAEQPANETAGIIPASLHGRWGLTPADCTSTRGDAKGLLIVSADGLKFYESVAKPAGTLETSPNSASGQFAFAGEGMTWTKFEALEVQDGKLVRTESDPMASFTYARCTS